jgi:predicted cobalt transporter CbtA
MIKYLYPALVAGLITGFFVTLFNLFLVQPLIAEAELLELHSASTAHEHSHDGGEGDSLINERNFLTLLVNIAMSVALSLIVIGFYYIRGGPSIAKNLLQMAFSGFFIFFLLPKLLILPQLPGQSLGNTKFVQILWILTTLGSIAILMIADRLNYFSIKLLLLLSLTVISIFILQNTDLVLHKTDALHSTFIYYTFISNLILWTLLYLNLNYFIKD